LPIKAPTSDKGTITRVRIRDLIILKPDAGNGKADKAKINIDDRAPDINPAITPPSDSFIAASPPTTAPI
jgi:hypothetical protein